MNEKAKHKIEEWMKTSLGLCKNKGCLHKRRHGSAYCQECSDKWHKNHDAR